MNRVQIRNTIYRGRPGFLVSGGPTLYVTRIFTASRHRAELLKLALKSDVTVDERFALTSLILCSPRIA
jgi:hypothetical protein